ncbi:diguanylate cyclase [Malaciobacter sp. WC5094]
MKKIYLEKLIYKNYLKTSLTSILLIEILLIIIYFSVNSNMAKISIDFLLKDIKTNTNELVETKIQNLSNKFSQIENLTKILQNEHKYFFENKDMFIYKNHKNLFKYTDDGVFYKEVDNGGSSLILSKKTQLTKEVEEKIYLTEYFDKTFKSIVQNDSSIIATHFNSVENFTRYYPFIENIYDVLPKNLEMTNYDFYNKALDKYNLSRKPIWTEVYLDPAGKGWMMSSIAPIYNNNILEGVSGIDVTINTFINDFLNIKLPYQGKSFILSSSGKIVAMEKEIESILNISEVTAYNYKDSLRIEKTIYKSEKFNLLNYYDNKIANTFKNILKSKPFNNKILIEDKKYLLFAQKLENTSWYIISLISEDKVLEKINNLKVDYKKLGYLIIACILVFYFVFFIFLYFKAKYLVNTINKPISKIIDLTRNIGRLSEVSKLEKCGIVEIDKLSENFNKMSKELNLRTKKLVESETKRVLNEKLANIDALSGAYNRRFLDEFIEGYLKIVKREKNDLSILLIDIDDFKKINDTYGHDIGDEVIKHFVETTKQAVRKNDLLIRYGGDEFLVLLPNTNLDSSFNVAQKIAQKIKNSKFNEKYNYTLSIGRACYIESDNSIDDIIIRADKALYAAKDKGKNTIV